MQTDEDQCARRLGQLERWAGSTTQQGKLNYTKNVAVSFIQSSICAILIHLPQKSIVLGILEIH